LNVVRCELIGGFEPFADRRVVVGAVTHTHRYSHSAKWRFSNLLTLRRYHREQQ
jgi:hypothetical protein